MLNRITSSHSSTGRLSASQGVGVRMQTLTQELKAMEVRPLNERTPIYMGLITLTSALAAVTQVWAGVVTFGLIALVFEGINRWFSRLSRH